MTPIEYIYIYIYRPQDIKLYFDMEFHIAIWIQLINRNMKCWRFGHFLLHCIIWNTIHIYLTDLILDLFVWESINALHVTNKTKIPARIHSIFVRKYSSRWYTLYYSVFVKDIIIKQFSHEIFLFCICRNLCRSS